MAVEAASRHGALKENAMKKNAMLFAAATVLFCRTWAAGTPSFHESLRARMPALRVSLPAVVAAGEAVAERQDANPYSAIRIPAGECAGLNEELIARAGGLSRIGVGRPSPEDTLIFGVRDWERFGPRAAWLVEQWKDEGKLVIVIGSEAGRPADLKADFFLDNGAPDGSSAHGSVNAAANVALAWMWCCEYASAFSRRGKFPAITKGLLSPDSWFHNDGTKAPDGGVRFYRCDTPIPEGDLALAYLNRFAKLLADIREPCVTKSIRQSAEIIADRMAAGHRVAIAGLGHMILEEPKHDLKSPMIGFRAVSMIPDSLQYTLEKGDILVWVTYNGMNSAWDDYAHAIRRCGADLIASYAETPTPGPREGLLAFIPQPWASPDAEVAIPVPPYSMAPVSAIARILVLRMLDEEVASVLSERGLDIKRPEIAMPDAFHDFGQRIRSSTSAARGMPDPGDRWGVLDSNGCVAVKAEYRNPPWVARDGRVHFHENGTNVVIDIGTGETTRNQAAPRPKPQPTRIGTRFAGKGDFRMFCTNGLWGALAKDGSVRVEPLYDNLRKISDKLLVSQVGEKYGIIDVDGREIVPPVFDIISPQSGFFAVCSNYLFGVMAPDASRLLTPPRYAYQPQLVSANVVKASLGGKVGFFTLDGEEVLAPTYDRIGPVTADYALVMKNGRWSFLPRGTNAPSAKGDFEKIAWDPWGNFRVEEGRHFGLLSPSGEQTAPIEYETISRSREPILGHSIVKDKDGKLVIIWVDGTTRPFPFQCDYANYLFTSARPSGQKQLFRVVRNGKWGIVDLEGRIVLPLDYEYITSGDRDGFIQIAVGGQWRLDADVPPVLHGAKWGACDASGRILVKPEYDGLERRGGVWLYVMRERNTVVTP